MFYLDDSEWIEKGNTWLTKEQFLSFLSWSQRNKGGNDGENKCTDMSEILDGTGHFLNYLDLGDEEADDRER